MIWSSSSKNYSLNNTKWVSFLTKTKIRLTYQHLYPRLLAPLQAVKTFSQEPKPKLKIQSHFRIGNTNFKVLIQKKSFTPTLVQMMSEKIHTPLFVSAFISRKMQPILLSSSSFSMISTRLLTFNLFHLSEHLRLPFMQIFQK